MRGHLLKIMILWLGLADLLQEERVQGYFDVKSSWLAVGILLGEAKAFLFLHLLYFHIFLLIFFLMVNRQGLTRSKSKLWSRIRIVGLFSLVTSGSDTHWVPVTRAFFFFRKHGLSYHLLPCAQAPALSLHPYALLIIQYQMPPTVSIRLSAQLIPCHRAGTLHFIATLYVLKHCFNKNPLYSIVQKPATLWVCFLGFFGFYFKTCPGSPPHTAGGAHSALDSHFAIDSSTWGFQRVTLVWLLSGRERSV